MMEVESLHVTHPCNSNRKLLLLLLLLLHGCVTCRPSHLLVVSRLKSQNFADLLNCATSCNWWQECSITSPLALWLAWRSHRMSSCSPCVSYQRLHQRCWKSAALSFLSFPSISGPGKARLSSWVMRVGQQKHWWSSQSSSQSVNTGQNKLWYIKKKKKRRAPNPLNPQPLFIKKGCSWTLGAPWLCHFSISCHNKDASSKVVCWITNEIHFFPLLFFLSFIISWIIDWVVYFSGMLRVL